MLLQRGTFCEAYVAQARVFRTYSSWVLTMLLSKVRRSHSGGNPWHGDSGNDVLASLPAPTPAGFDVLFYYWTRLIVPCWQAGLRTHTFPRTLFQLANYTSEGLDCIPDKPPVERPISFGSASSTLGDAEEVRT